MDPRPHDIVLFGATGFTGRQVAAWFARHVARSDVRWALAARNLDKLAAVRDSLGSGFGDVPVLQVDALDEDAVRAMAASARVVLTTVGPYALYGDRLVDACVASKTDYVDITGETPWVRRVIARHHAQAARDGTRIVPFCGFDSVPSDLGTWMIVQHLRQRHGQTTREVRASFRAKGGFNGGTLASALNLLGAERPRDMADPFALNPPERHPGPAPSRSQDLTNTHRDPDLGHVAPFFMAPVNTRVVRRSDALSAERGAGYGPEFAYQEALSVKGPAMGWGVLAAMSAVPLMARSSFLRGIAMRLGPDPGEGPSESDMDGGWFTTSFIGIGDGGARVRGFVKAEGDPGNRCTVEMLCTSALVLLQDRERLPPGGGVLTPAVAFGDLLLARLQRRGMVWEIEDVD
ncbi:MAG: saccharopine dehydrogenase NADP-binding domain-containing protein [Myxococcota bacterium]|nr:saccharopine dehydrogenase NADP-binding domain-containing protein [Myxococcota bacterium]